MDSYPSQKPYKEWLYLLKKLHAPLFVLLFCLIFIYYLYEKQRYRKMNRETLHLLIHYPSVHIRDWPTWKQKLSLNLPCGGKSNPTTQAASSWCGWRWIKNRARMWLRHTALSCHAPHDPFITVPNDYPSGMFLWTSPILFWRKTEKETLRTPNFWFTPQVSAALDVGRVWSQDPWA